MGALELKQKLLGIIVFLFLMSLVGGGCVIPYPTKATSPGPSEKPCPSFQPPSRLFVLENSSLNDAERVMIQGLQGILSQAGGRENIWIDFPKGYKIWLSELKDYGVTLDRGYQNDPWGLVDYFKSFLNNKGYVLYELGKDSENVATTLARLYKILPLDLSLEEEAKKHGLKECCDVRGKDEKWCFRLFWPKLNHQVVCLLKEDIHDSLRDFAVASKAFIFQDGKSRFMRKVFHAMDEGGVVLGWGTCGESEFVAPASQYDLMVVAADHAHNLSVLSKFNPGEIRQKNHVLAPTTGEKVHYVTFIMSDGDNVQWLLNDFATDERWYGSPLRAQFPMGWTISPSLIDLAPMVMQWLYKHATENDFFISGVSGRGYFYPSNFPNLEEEATKLNKYLGKADLNLVCLLDIEYKGFCRENLEPYAAQPNIIGGFWLWYDDYVGRKGDIIFVNGKPFVSARYSLWGRKKGCDPGSIASAINALPANPHSISGYSMVTVHPWTMGLSEVKKVISSLNSNVRVVGPEEFLRLIKENLSPEKISSQRR